MLQETQDSLFVKVKRREGNAVDHSFVHAPLTLEGKLTDFTNLNSTSLLPAIKITKINSGELEAVSVSILVSISKSVRSVEPRLVH